jgi:hypothetical protein
VKEGAFAFIDCLGWKGISKRVKSPAALIDKLKEIERLVEQVKHDKNRLIFPRVKKTASVAFLSDTVVVSVQPRDSSDRLSEEDKGELIAALCFVVLELLNLFLSGRDPVPMRGCITYGEHIIDGNFILGEAVDAAAQNEKLADGAFVWLHPEAASMFSKFTKQFNKNLYQGSLLKVAPEQDLEAFGEGSNIREKIAFVLDRQMPSAFVIPDYPLPIKDGKVLACSVLNPLIVLTDRSRIKRVKDAYAKAMKGSIEILVKKQNTERFLAVAEKCCDDCATADKLVEIIQTKRNQYHKKFPRGYQKDS